MRILVAGWIGSTNLGDELVLAGLLRKLARRGVEAEVVSVRPAATEATHGVAAVDHRDVRGLWAAVGRADGLVFGGGGIVQHKSSAFNLPYHLSRPWLARLRGRPWAGVGLGAGPVDTWVGRRLVRTLNSAVAVSVRDDASARLLARCGVPGATVAADLAFALPPVDRPADDVLVVCLRPWVADPGRLPVGASRRTSVRTPHWFVEQTAPALAQAARTTGLRVRFVALQADRDGPLHERVAARMDTDVELVTPGLHDVVETVASGRVVVTMRLHAGLAAVLGGRPLVLVDYTPKLSSLAGDVGAGAAALDYEPGGMRGLPEAVGRVLGRDGDVAAARERLCTRERGNDLTLDRLLEVAARRRGV